MEAEGENTCLWHEDLRPFSPKTWDFVRFLCFVIFHHPNMQHISMYTSLRNVTIQRLRIVTSKSSAPHSLTNSNDLTIADIDEKRRYGRARGGRGLV